MLTVVAGLSLAIWCYLLALHGGFWHADQRLGGDSSEPNAPSAWPAVVVLVPARDEAEVIGEAVAALLAQDYPGPFQVVLIDDHSTDGTAALAERAARDATGNTPGRFQTIAAPELPAGWTGKLWALQAGLAHADGAHADSTMPDAPYLWLSDADIAPGPATLRRLVAKAETGKLNLVSLMVALSCRGRWERLLIPPFIYFFQMLYPFPWINDPAKATAAAAGGCLLLRREALARAGGFAGVKGALIDDCALARAIKALPEDAGGNGGIWLGLATESRSIRPYRGLGEIWRMVARSAYTQLRHAPLLLLGTLLAMTLTFLAPPSIALTAGFHDHGVAAFLAAGAWALMALTAVPTLLLYRQPTWLAALLPLAGAFYCAMTLDSAWRHWRGAGGAWKDRVHPGPPKL